MVRSAWPKRSVERDSPALFDVLRTHMGSRPAMTFVRTDNAPSLQAHRKMGMRDLGPFVHEGVPYIAFEYPA
jgi:hypothetical protein